MKISLGLATDDKPIAAVDGAYWLQAKTCQIMNDLLGVQSPCSVRFVSPYRSLVLLL